jgi:hypothetical protein
MGAMKDLIAYGIVILLSLAGGAYFLPKGSTKVLNQNISATNAFVNTLRDMATDFSSVNPTQDFQNISMEELASKNILPTNITITGTGSSSSINPPHDTKQVVKISDPNSASATDKGKQYQIDIDATASKMNADDKQVWEDKLKSQFELGGGKVSNYTSTNADGRITVTFE